MLSVLICITFPHSGLFNLICGNVHGHLFTVFAFCNQALMKFATVQRYK